MTENPDMPKLRDRIRELRSVLIADIVGFSAGNPKDRTEFDRDILDASLTENGYIMPVMVRDRGEKSKGGRYELLDGHGRIERIKVLYPTTTEIQVLIVECESVAEGRLMILGMKNTAAWDMGALDEWVRAGLKDGIDGDKIMKVSGLTAADLDSIGEWGAGALRDLEERKPQIESNEPPPKDDGPRIPGLIVEVDIPDEVPVKTISKPGTIWKLGNSRLICGDSTVPEVIRAALMNSKPDLVWTDPPWNVELDAANKPSGRSSSRKTNTTIANDALGAGFPAFLAAITKAMVASTDPGTPVYIAMAVQEMGPMTDALKANGFHWSSTIIWAKQALVLSRKDFHPQYEPIWYGWREGAPRKCAPTDRAMSDLWTIDRPRKSDLHPSMKPIALVARSINASSKPGDLVLDMFGGSGTTLLAAEQLGRRAALVELSPGYTDIIVQRWESLTGKKATKG